ncbi:hypothetical protein M409DRAFT_57852 [Zasmidium cellare ATCC 36951]|uniref:Uncharacterized protein n=1 Tax=Zasmidium cellare ATCC 36951 TaxID=1080233 RepID=A0A6A6C7G0_ZASCE|nr:uncharacterized protein M409DRAFT_57852 [Zasmidium cellare ATCC 36951]KAF2162783.1 hypothetical protein M409DRAFT_57852 [Zasmidium cellare ATCC 36951]
MAESGIHEGNKVRLFTRRNALAALMDREDEVKTRAGSARGSPPFSPPAHARASTSPHSLPVLSHSPARTAPQRPSTSTSSPPASRRPRSATCPAVCSARPTIISMLLILSTAAENHLPPPASSASASADPGAEARSLSVAFHRSKLYPTTTARPDSHPPSLPPTVTNERLLALSLAAPLFSHVNGRLASTHATLLLLCSLASFSPHHTARLTAAPPLCVTDAARHGQWPVPTRPSEHQHHASIAVAAGGGVIIIIVAIIFASPHRSIMVLLFVRHTACATTRTPSTLAPTPPSFPPTSGRQMSAKAPPPFISSHVAARKVKWVFPKTALLAEAREQAAAPAPQNVPDYERNSGGGDVESSWQLQSAGVADPFELQRHGRTGTWQPGIFSRLSQASFKGCLVTPAGKSCARLQLWDASTLPGFTHARHSTTLDWRCAGEGACCRPRDFTRCRNHQHERQRKAPESSAASLNDRRKEQ